MKLTVDEPSYLASAHVIHRGPLGKAIGYARNQWPALLRLSTCTDAKMLTPHGWKHHFEAEVTERRHAIQVP